ncbi:uncharacterized protein, partial [Diabrotica undecimpunctata]|uniref:uncharacterized protein n=1 Tax=Diabrotica undecimpunctata TaxID=50387 RepID=UPI003B63A977
MDQQPEIKNVPDNEKDSQAHIQELLSEKKKIQEEFDIQRAKFKDLFLLKEAELDKKVEENVQLTEELTRLKNELDDCKSQLVVDSMTLESTFEVEKRKAEEEIATLQRLVHETVEESSSTRTLYDTELKKLEHYIQQLQKEIHDLKREKNHSPHHISQVCIHSTSFSEENADNTLTEELLSVDCWGDVISDPAISYDFVNVDEDVAVCGEITDAQIMAEVLKDSNEKQESAEKDASSVAGEINVPSAAEATNHITQLRRYFKSKND